jgi:predicted ATPase
MTGINILPENGWQTHDQLMLTLHELGAEVALLCGNIEPMKDLIATVLKQVKSLPKRTKVYEVQVQAYLLKSCFRDAVELILEAVSSVDSTFIQHPTSADIQSEFDQVITHLKNRSIQNLASLPSIIDPTYLAIARLLVNANAPAYVSTPEWLPFIVAKQVNLYLEYGNTEVSPLSYAFAGAILCKEK